MNSVHDLKLSSPCHDEGLFSPNLSQVARALPKSWTCTGTIVRAAACTAALALPTRRLAGHDPKSGS